jgi:hypothetical protein
MALLAGLTSAASADAQFDTGKLWYFNTVFNGQIQCAGRDTWSSYVGGYSGTYAVTATSYAAVDLFCVHAFPLPHNWIQVNAVTQVADNPGGPWSTIGGANNVNTANHDSITVGYGPWPYSGKCVRTVSAHAVAVAGGYQDFIYIDPSPCSV